MFALSFRLAVFWSLPSLSGDLYRYRWEGLARADGLNPYLVQPDQPSTAHLRDATYARISSPFRKAGYGPLWIEVEHATARIVRRVTGNAWLQVRLFKLPSIGADLLTLWLLARLLAVRGLPFSRWAMYAWCPLPVMEFWHEGHNDSWVAAALLAALLLAERARWQASFAALTAGALVKFWPALLFPVFAFGRTGTPGGNSPRWWQWWVAVPLTVPFVLLFWAPVTENVDFMSGFLGGWRNNDSLFGLVLWAAGAARAKYAVAAILLAMVAVLAMRRVEPGRATLLFTAGLLLVSANVHPWYLSWFVPMLALYPALPLFVWVGLMPLAYGVLAEFHATGVWNGSTPRRWWIYGPVFVACVVALVRRRRIA